MNYDCFAVTAPGLEQVCAAELRALGMTVQGIDGGVEWSGDTASIYRANLHLRSASRVVVRVGSFRARGFPELERHVTRIDWNAIVPHQGNVGLRVTSTKSRLYHEGAIAERIERVLAGSGITSARTTEEESDSADALLIIVRVLRDEFTISIDSSGTLLHQRGYRRAVAMAPLRETIAAAMILAAEWDPATPLIDPFCGSGTIPIEAALIARGIPPGMANADLTPRRFSFENWTAFDARLWKTIVNEAREAVRRAAMPLIIGSDRHGGAITAARSNAERAGVADTIELRRAALSALTPPPGPGALITNPPYGVRVGERRALEPLYRELGRVARELLEDWSIDFLAADDRLAAATGLPLAERLATRNGGIAVRQMYRTAGGLTARRTGVRVAES